MDSKLRKLQLTQFKILLEVKRICEKYNISYFLDGGTLLGAVRHKGFIPWDDDIDVGMLREDYMKFLKVCDTELSDQYFLQTKDTDTKCGLVMAKIRLNGTKRLDSGSINTTAHCGIDIDIFPFDNIPNKKINQWFYYNICWLLRGIFVIKSDIVMINRDKSYKKKFGIILCKFLSAFCSMDSLSCIIDSHFQRYNSKKTEYVISSAGSYHYTKELIKREEIIEKAYLPFEGVLFPVPRNYHEYLSNLYGDYMTLPPKEKRVQHPIAELDLGIYEETGEQNPR